MDKKKTGIAAMKKPEFRSFEEEGQGDSINVYIYVA